MFNGKTECVEGSLGQDEQVKVHMVAECNLAQAQDSLLQGCLAQGIPVQAWMKPKLESAAILR